MPNGPHPCQQKFDSYAADYSNLMAANLAASGESHCYFQIYKVNCLVRLGIGASSRILDYGCGVGALTEHLVARYPRVEGYDPSPKSVESARVRVSQARIHDSPEAIDEDAFDVAVLSGVLHHVPPADRPGLLTNVRSKLVPGGKLVIFEHNPWNLLTRRAVSDCPFDDDAILLWPRELKRLTHIAGFDPVTLEYIVFFPKALARLRPWEPRLNWLFLGAQTMTVAVR